MWRFIHRLFDRPSLRRRDAIATKNARRRRPRFCTSGLRFEDLERRELLTATVGTGPSTSAPTAFIGVGDFDGDGREDVVSRKRTGEFVVSLASEGSAESTVWGQFTTATEWNDVAVGDFNGDGLSDVIGRAAIDGTFWIGLSTGSSFSNSYWGKLLNSVEWFDITVGDFNDDGRDDTIARAADGTWWTSVSNGSRLVNSFAGRWSPGDWEDVVVGDFDGNGFDDVAGRRNGVWWVGLLSNERMLIQPWGHWTTTQGWREVRVVDINADGRDDILGRADNDEVWSSRSVGNRFKNVQVRPSSPFYNAGIDPQVFDESTFNPFEESIQLAGRTDVPLEQQGFKLHNESDFEARFALEFNGNISRNLSHLVEQIREFELPSGEEIPDYEKAYYYMMEYQQHDFPVTPEVWLHDPTFYLNGISAGLCDDSASVLATIWREMGYESRVWLLTGHVVSEVFTGERWQMYDADLRVHYYNDHGQVAGVEEMAAAPRFIRHARTRLTDNSTAYSGRTTTFYMTTENNRICTSCLQYEPTPDLIFEIPAGGSLEWGEAYTDQELPVVHLGTPTKYGQLKVTIPAGSKGSLDIPLSILDIQGSADDAVRVDGAKLKLGGNNGFNYFKSSSGNRVNTISFDNNAEPIEVVYIFNERFTEIQASNQIEIAHETSSPAALRASTTVLK